jgi:hypothetical protein
VPHTVAIDGRAVGFGDLRHDTDRVGKYRLVGQQRIDGTPGKLAVTDLTPPCAGHAAHLTHRERREIVVQHEVLLVGAFQ